MKYIADAIACAAVVVIVLLTVWMAFAAYSDGGVP